MKKATQDQIMENLELIVSTLEIDHSIQYHDYFQQPTGLMSNDKAATLKLDVRTRWSSILIMFESMIKNREIINRALQEIYNEEKDPSVLEINLTAGEWNTLTEFADFLMEFRSVTELLSGDTYSTLSSVLIFRQELIRTVKDSDFLDDTEEKRKFTNEIEKRIPISDFNIIAALLDPVTKNLEVIDDFLKNEREIDASKFLLLTMDQFSLNSTKAVEPQPQTNRTGPPELAAKRAKIIQQHSITAGNSANLISQYLSYSPDSNICDPLDWWKVNGSLFSTLVPLVKVVHSIPATSTPSERSFSHAKRVITSDRNRLMGHTVSMTMFIHDNAPLLRKILENMK